MLQREWQAFKIWEYASSFLGPVYTIAALSPGGTILEQTPSTCSCMPQTWKCASVATLGHPL